MRSYFIFITNLFFFTSIFRFWDFFVFSLFFDRKVFCNLVKSPIKSEWQTGWLGSWSSVTRCCTVCFTDLDQGSEIISKFSYAKSMKHTVVAHAKISSKKSRPLKFLISQSRFINLAPNTLITFFNPDISNLDQICYLGKSTSKI